MLYGITLAYLGVLRSQGLWNLDERRQIENTGVPEGITKMESHHRALGGEGHDQL